ncbi:coproporphyrinogen III oxidase [Rhodovulum sulfidophilum]|uniref:radical SAM family heme chaperone HemW n=1 Tax=Rhodovulum sulfidophilum TaxID=35806 RepID=UPI0019286C5F|nr:radical SAM family heme chaperone HemW [Rhodovulum sulfidophilum]MBL3585732.1 coproporphyrinogen III oxidase [Rhodovulum sulfidophilum]
MTADDWQEGGFGLYVHWPFCLSKCPYCDFNSHVSAEIDTARWQEAYLSEIRRLGAETGPRVLNTVFFGGGTPSLMPPELVGAILDTARSVWTPANDIEVTLEANPTSVEAGRFTGFAEAGVNRVSLGIQALNDADLRRLGRTHSVAEARTAFDIARSRFPRVSFDLIYARQSQSIAAWRDELGEALAMAVDHLSLYQLTVEAGTAFGDRLARGGLKGLPDEDLGADLYELTQELCETAGMPAYEVSNHARPGAESRHNLIYWQAGDYAGGGPGAHGRLTLGGRRTATDTPLPPMSWLERVERQGTGELSRSTVAPADQGAEYLMMGLRLAQGLSLRRYERIANSQIDGSKIKELSDLGLIETEADHLRATAAGRAVLNAVIRALLPD